MSKPFQPMLSADILKGIDCKKEDDVYRALRKLPFPVLGSPKFDGYRAIEHQYKLMSRNLKPIRNVYTQELVGRDWEEIQGADGELIVGQPYAEDVFRQTSSGVTTIKGKPDVRYWVFDSFHASMAGQPYWRRLLHVGEQVKFMQAHALNASIVLHTALKNVDELLAFEAKCLDRGYEGIMVRTPQGLYRQGRTTLIEAYLHKVKRFVDDEAEIIGFTELMHNANELTTNERGYAKRSSHKANKHGRGTFGAFICRWRNGAEFNCGSGKGMTFEERDKLWKILTTTPRAIIGRKWLKFSYLPIGVKDKPRHPKYLALINKEDVPHESL